jgi:uncharacterized protein (TIGR02145 family)
MITRNITLAAIAASFAFSTAFAGTLSKGCMEEIANLSGKSGFDAQKFISDLPSAAIKVKTQAKAPLQFLFGPGPDNKVTDVGLTVGCLKTFPESPGEIQSSLMDVKSSLMGAGLEMGKNAVAGELGNNIDPVAFSGVSSKCDIKDYKTVKIGDQTWMAENLNCNVNGSKCYGNKTENCNKYGRLYNWSTARSVCPYGWRLPSNVDWTTLTNFVGNSAGTKLKATIGWNDYSRTSGNGTDTYDFSALPGGYGNYNGSFFTAGTSGGWWSTSENDANNAYTRNMGFSSEYAYNYSNDKSYLFSVRCVKN